MAGFNYLLCGKVLVWLRYQRFLRDIVRLKKCCDFADKPGNGEASHCPVLTVGGFVLRSGHLNDECYGADDVRQNS